LHWRNHLIGYTTINLCEIRKTRKLEDEIPVEASATARAMAEEETVRLRPITSSNSASVTFGAWSLVCGGRVSVMNGGGCPIGGGKPGGGAATGGGKNAGLT
jgi:hypothetical protein